MGSTRATRTRAARLFWVAWLGLAAVAVVVVVRETVATGGADPPPSTPACRDLDLAKSRERVTCRTPSATLTLAGEGTPVVLGPTEVRVLGSRLEGRRLTVRLRLRNDTATAARVELGRRQVYVNVAGRRVFPAPLLGGRKGDGTPTLRLRFRLPRAVARDLRRGDARAELGIVPWDELGAERPARLGVVRLEPK